jgi:hypothetical protein
VDGALVGAGSLWPSWAKTHVVSKTIFSYCSVIWKWSNALTVSGTATEPLILLPGHYTQGAHCILRMDFTHDPNCPRYHIHCYLQFHRRQLTSFPCMHPFLSAFMDIVEVPRAAKGSQVRILGT